MLGKGGGRRHSCAGPSGASRVRIVAMLKKAKTCPDCKRDFGVFRWRHECSRCHRTMCADCSREWLELEIGRNDYSRDVHVCAACFPAIQEVLDRTATIKIVRSEHIGGHRVTERLGEIVSRIQRRDLDLVKRDLAYNAIVMRGNAVLRFSFDRDTKEEEDSNYRYSVFTGRGEAASIESRAARYADQKPPRTEPSQEAGRGAASDDGGPPQIPFVRCPACDRRLSSQARTCPGCGQPMTSR
jgi:hypothetical protein